MKTRIMLCCSFVLVLSIALEAQTIPVNVVVIQSPTYPQPQSAATIGTTWTRLTDAFTGFSYGRVTFTNTVLGPFTVTDASLTSCDRASMKTQIATQYGGALPVATKTMYVLPLSVVPGLDTSNTNSNGVVCNRFGSLVLGSTEAWGLSGKFGWSLGGLFGLHRAAAEGCGRNTDCTLYTPEGHTGDKYDVLATGSGMNVLERLWVGWLPAANVQTVTSAGTFTLTAVEAPLDGRVRALKIPRTDTLPEWYVEVRQVTTTTKLLGTVTATVVLLHRPYYVNAPGLPTVLEDVNPISVTTQENVDYVLNPGQTFVDPYTGIAITTRAILDVSTAQIDVAFHQLIPVPPPIVVTTKRIRR